MTISYDGTRPGRSSTGVAARRRGDSRRSSGSDPADHDDPDQLPLHQPPGARLRRCLSTTFGRRHRAWPGQRGPVRAVRTLVFAAAVEEPVRTQRQLESEPDRLGRAAPGPQARFRRGRVGDQLTQQRQAEPHHVAAVPVDAGDEPPPSPSTAKARRRAAVRRSRRTPRPLRVRPRSGRGRGGRRRDAAGGQRPRTAAGGQHPGAAVLRRHRSVASAASRGFPSPWPLISNTESQPRTRAPAGRSSWVDTAAHLSSASWSASSAGSRSASCDSSTPETTTTGSTPAARRVA